MTSFPVQPLKFLAATAAAIWLTAPFIASAAAAETGDADPEQQLIDQIEEALSRDGAYSVSLLEPLTTLSLLYQESGDHGLALVTIERALQVVRVNHGLHTLDQVPLVWQKIRIEEARGNSAAVWELEQDLLTLISRYPDELRTVPLLREMADRQMTTLREYLDGEIPPAVIYGCFYKEWPAAGGGGCEAGSRKTVVQGMLAEAQRNYARAIAVMLRHGLYDSDELRALEMELLLGVDLMRTSFEALAPSSSLAQYVEPWRSRLAPLIELASWDVPYASDRAHDEAAKRNIEATQPRLRQTYYRGRQSLRRLYAYEAAGSSPSLAQADAMAQVADWDLLYSYNGLAVEGYEFAHAMLQAAGVPAASIQQIFAPPTPVVLPAFKPNPLAADETGPATGYINVAFTLTKYGKARDVEVRDVANATDADQRRLVNFITRSRFRPRVTDGQFAESTPVAFHYYLREPRELGARLNETTHSLETAADNGWLD